MIYGDLRGETSGVKAFRGIILGVLLGGSIWLVVLIVAVIMEGK